MDPLVIHQICIIATKASNLVERPDDIRSRILVSLGAMGGQASAPPGVRGSNHGRNHGKHQSYYCK